MVAVSVVQESNLSASAREAVAAATAVLQKTGRFDVPFGAERPTDEAEFLTAIDELLVELGVQFAARRLRSSDAFAGARAEVLSLRDRLLQAAPTCRCAHLVRDHRTTGCNWENTLGTEHCDCEELVSGLAPVQIRAYL